MYDDTLNTFTSFTVDWDGEVLDFTAAANAGAEAGGTCNAGPGNGAQQTLDMLTGVAPTGCAQSQQYQFLSHQFDNLGNPVYGQNAESISISDPGDTKDVSQSTFSVAVATPEPSSLALLALGLATLGMALRQRLHPRSEG